MIICSYEKLYLKMCAESGHQEFVPTQAIFEHADKEKEARNKLLKELLNKQPATPNLRSWRETADAFLQLKKDLRVLLTNNKDKEVSDEY